MIPETHPLKGGAREAREVHLVRVGPVHEELAEELVRLEPVHEGLDQNLAAPG